MPPYAALAALMSLLWWTLLAATVQAQETAFAAVPPTGEQIQIGQSGITVGGSTSTQFTLVGLFDFGGVQLMTSPTTIDAPFTLGSGETLSSTITDSFDQLIKVGSGTAVVAAPNAFENGVVIEAGRLRVERADYLSFNTLIRQGSLSFLRLKTCRLRSLEEQSLVLAASSKPARVT